MDIDELLFGNITRTLEPNNIMFDDDYANEVLEEKTVKEKRKYMLKICSVAAMGFIEHYQSHCVKNILHSSVRNGHKFIMELLESPSIRCYQNLRVHKEVFLNLCNDLSNRYGLQASRWVTIHESVAIFLMTIGHNVDNRLLQSIFNHSGDTISCHFHKVLCAVIKMSRDIIKPDQDYNSTVHPKLKEHGRHYPIFKDCIGAIDGTHVKVTVGPEVAAKFRGRKGICTQNILAVCDFNMCFTFVWAGWEGSAHDARIFSNALTDHELQFPHPKGDKYYVLDAGYSNTRGYLTPYTGENIRYHIPDIRRGKSRAVREPQGIKEKFNYLHSSIRNIIERTFGVWKARFAILQDMHKGFTYDHQVKIVVASMTIHNYIRKQSNGDGAFSVAEQESYNSFEDLSTEISDIDTETTPQNHSDIHGKSKVDNEFMGRFRDSLAVMIDSI